ncbi:polyphosphate polymerase domain-containing protein [Thermomonospora umbrina]|uniref:VTC domain-containing protein n=1 Tax=Thermomonospora umbrina TaxID=111806 RepID=A0A3D9SKG5_9ACTN|nr:polyphosphate polymerase domain-containing protein [Thermomonospora umbrina]REE96389.1 VTC domain-containing protein [Thermomonospora umbrina]
MERASHVTSGLGTEVSDREEEGHGVRAEDALEELAGALPPIDLLDMLARAELQVRLDRKYLVPAALCAEIVPRLKGEYAALDIGGRRRFRYSSTYFDTPDLLTFRQHLQGRRQRFKIRTRSYLDSGECMFELKLAGTRDATDKRRMAYDITRRAMLNTDARSFLTDVLLSAYRMNAPEALGPSATTNYLRSTLVQLSGSGRVTFDAGLVCAWDGKSVYADPGLVLVESKSAHADTPMDRVLRAFRLRPLSISKYCVAIAVLHPEVRANPWHAALRTYFGGRRPAASLHDLPTT